MKRVMIGLVAVGVLGIVLLIGGWVYLNMTAGTGEASAAISAPELTPAAAAEVTVFRIVPEESEVRFVIDEVLRGSPYTVIGTTDQVAGDLAVDLANPAHSEVGTIRVNVRTLETDDRNRTRALRSFILKSAEDAYEFAEFQPTAIAGLPESVTAGEPFMFQISGDLTVAGTTNPVTFETTATLDDASRLSGQAVATVQYPDFKLTIPNVPFVAGVNEDVRLELDFVAQAVDPAES
ncbi:MAG: YceI family protein [Anaerolineae bacterium]|nr:YceI family protein [Anaerolineae bacterium]